MPRTMLLTYVYYIYIVAAMYPHPHHHPRGRRARGRLRVGPSQWQVQARIERFAEPALLLLLRDGPTHGYELADSLVELVPGEN